MQRALGNLRLIGSVGGQELTARNQGINDDRSIMEIGARAQKAGVALAVLTRALAKEVDNLGLGHLARDVEIAGQPVLRRNRCKQIVDRAQANRL